MVGWLRALGLRVVPVVHEARMGNDVFCYRQREREGERERERERETETEKRRNNKSTK